MSYNLNDPTLHIEFANKVMHSLFLMYNYLYYLRCFQKNFIFRSQLQRLCLKVVAHVINQWTNIPYFLPNTSKNMLDSTIPLAFS